jgi:hypothetical protein
MTTHVEQFYQELNEAIASHFRKERVKMILEMDEQIVEFMETASLIRYAVEEGSAMHLIIKSPHGEWNVSYDTAYDEERIFMKKYGEEFVEKVFGFLQFAIEDVLAPTFVWDKKLSEAVRKDREGLLREMVLGKVVEKIEHAKDGLHLVINGIKIKVV